MPSEHEPNQPNQPHEPNDEPEQTAAEDARAWDEALLRARGELTDVAPSAIPDAGTDRAADSAPIELTHVRRKRRTSRQLEAVLPPQQVTVRRRRQTGSMSLSPPAGEAVPPADLAPAAPVPAAPVPASSPTPATPAPLDGSARARERSREREALERVLALAKPRARQTRATPAVLPPRPLGHGDDEPER